MTQPVPTASGPTPLVGPAPPTQPPFLLSGAIDLGQGYTTNATAGGSSGGRPDTFTRGQLDAGFHYDSLRIKADAHGSLSGYYYSRDHDNNQLTNQLNFTSQAELIPDHFFFNANSFATPVALTRVGQLSAVPGAVSNSNNRQTYGYVANPVFKSRLGDVAFSETSLSASQFFVSSSTSSTDPTLGITPVGNTTSTSVTERITSGPSFGPMKWGLTGSYSKMDQGTQTEQEKVAAVDFGYAFTRAITALAVVGYDQFQASVPLTQSLPAPIALAGVQYTYGPTFNLVVAAGIAHGFTTYLGSLNWSPTATFKVVGSLTDGITTPQADILNNLSTLAASAQGVFTTSQSYYWQTGASALNPQFASASPVPQFGLALDNSISRDRTAQLAFLHTDERNQYGLSFFGDLRDRQNVVTTGLPSRSWLYGAQLSGSRKLQRNLTAFAGVSYSYANEFGGNDKIITVNTGLNYALSEKMECYVTGNYLQRQSNGQTVTNQASSSDAVVIVGVRRKL